MGSLFCIPSKRRRRNRSNQERTGRCVTKCRSTQVHHLPLFFYRIPLAPKDWGFALKGPPEMKRTLFPRASGKWNQATWNLPAATCQPSNLQELSGIGFGAKLGQKKHDQLICLPISASIFRFFFCSAPSGVQPDPSARSDRAARIRWGRCRGAPTASSAAKTGASPGWRAARSGTAPVGRLKSCMAQVGIEVLRSPS